MDWKGFSLENTEISKVIPNFCGTVVYVSDEVKCWGLTDLSWSLSGEPPAAGVLLRGAAFHFWVQPCLFLLENLQEPCRSKRTTVTLRHCELIQPNVRFFSVLSNRVFLPSGFDCSCSGLKKWAGAFGHCRTSREEPLSASELLSFLFLWLAVWLDLGILDIIFSLGSKHSVWSALCVWCRVLCMFWCPPMRRYVGEIISDAEADVREIDSYLFSLDSKVAQD